MFGMLQRRVTPLEEEAVEDQEIRSNVYHLDYQHFHYVIVQY